MFQKALFLSVAISITFYAHCKESSHSGIEVIQDGPIQIIGVNEILHCDGIICPRGSIFCYVQIDSIVDENGDETNLVIDVQQNPEPGEQYHFSSSNYDIE